MIEKNIEKIREHAKELAVKHRQSLIERAESLSGSIAALTFGTDLIRLQDCGCGAKPGQIHDDGCDVEICSVCGLQRIQCDHSAHDKQFARWTGFWPGSLEAHALGVDLNDFRIHGFHELFLVKPKAKAATA